MFKEWAKDLLEEEKAVLKGEEVIIRGVPLELPSPDEERKLEQLFHQNA